MTTLITLDKSLQVNPYALTIDEYRATMAQIGQEIAASVALADDDDSSDELDDYDPVTAHEVLDDMRADLLWRVRTESTLITDGSA